jgi:hypothetical protein
MTQFVDIYNRFLGKITDDMYVELTPQDTIKDLRNMLIDAIPGFEFPRKNLQDYTILEDVKPENELTENDFVLGILWDDTLEDEDAGKPPLVVVEKSNFTANLNSEEINILAILMMCAWVQRQVTSIENTRMKYSGSDFKMTSQANHLQKLLALLGECQRQSHHMQRLYKRRRISKLDDNYRSNWENALGHGVYY